MFKHPYFFLALGIVALVALCCVGKAYLSRRSRRRTEAEQKYRAMEFITDVTLLHSKRYGAGIFQKLRTNGGRDVTQDLVERLEKAGLFRDPTFRPFFSQLLLMYAQEYQVWCEREALFNKKMEKMLKSPKGDLVHSQIMSLLNEQAGIRRSLLEAKSKFWDLHYYCGELGIPTAGKENGFKIYLLLKQDPAEKVLQ